MLDVFRRLMGFSREAAALGVASRSLTTHDRLGYNLYMTVATSRTRSNVGVRELKNQLSSFLDRVKSGEEITVTEHGRPIARLSAVGRDTDRMAELVAAGIVLPASGRRQLPQKRVKLAEGASVLADLVFEQRG